MHSLLTVRETASLLNISPCTVYRYVQHDGIPYIKKDFGLRFREEEITSWLNRSAVIPPYSNITSPGKDLGLRIYTGRGDIREMAKSKSKSRLNLGYGAVYQRKTKRGKIRWYLDYRDSKGKRVQKVAMHASTAEDAQVALQKEVAGVFNRSYGIGSQKERISFKEFNKVYLETYAAVRKKSWRSDEKYLKAQLIPYFGNFELHEITPYHVSQFIAKRLKDGVRKSTINRELTVLKKMLNLGIEWGFEITKNPVIKGNYFPEEEYRRDRILTLDEEKSLFLAASTHLRAILVCALTTGMRFSEVLGLCWGNVDLEKKQITVRAESSKSGRSRIIPINQTLYNLLAGLKARNGQEGNVFLYKDPLTGRERPIKTIRRAFNQACRRADIKNLRFHDLRHTFGSRLIDRGCDPVSVKNLLGHANLKTTEIYLHSSLGQMKRAVDLLDPKPVDSAHPPPNLLPICDTETPPVDRDRPNDSWSIN